MRFLCSSCKPSCHSSSGAALVWNSSTHWTLALFFTMFAAAPTVSRSLLSHHSLTALPQSCYLLLTSDFEAYPHFTLLLPLSLLVHPLASGPPCQKHIFCSSTLHIQYTCKVSFPVCQLLFCLLKRLASFI